MNDIKEELPLLVATVTSAALGIGVALFPPRLVVVVVVVALFRFDSAVVGVVFDCETVLLSESFSAEFFSFVADVPSDSSAPMILLI